MVTPNGSPLAATVSATPYRERGFVTVPVAEEAVLGLGDFSLQGKARADVRHAVASARRLGLHVRDWAPDLAEQVDAISTAWLATKRGGEMGFTLGRLTGPELRVFRWLLRWAQRYAPLREDALADVGLGWPVVPS